MYLMTILTCNYLIIKCTSHIITAFLFRKHLFCTLVMFLNALKS